MRQYNFEGRAVEAMRLGHGLKAMVDVLNWINWQAGVSIGEENNVLQININGNVLDANPGDWIVKVGERQFFPMHPRVFEALLVESDADMVNPSRRLYRERTEAEKAILEDIMSRAARGSTG